MFPEPNHVKQKVALSHDVQKRWLNINVRFVDMSWTMNFSPMNSIDTCPPTWNCGTVQLQNINATYAALTWRYHEKEDRQRITPRFTFLPLIAQTYDLAILSYIAASWLKFSDTLRGPETHSSFPSPFLPLARPSDPPAQLIRNPERHPVLVINSYCLTSAAHIIKDILPLRFPPSDFSFIDKCMRQP